MPSVYCYKGCFGELAYLYELVDHFLVLLAYCQHVRPVVGGHFLHYLGGVHGG